MAVTRKFTVFWDASTVSEKLVVSVFKDYYKNRDKNSSETLVNLYQCTQRHATEIFIEIEILRREHCTAYLKTMSEEMTGDWRILRNERVRNFHSITASYHWTRDGSGSILTRLNGRGRGFDCQRGQMLTVFIETSRHLCSTQHPMQLVSEMLVWEAHLSLVSLLRTRGVIPPSLHTPSCIMLYHVPYKC